MHIYSGQYKNRTISSPKGLQTRPTSGRLRECLFNICQGEIEGAHFLDLFAGSGAMGLEALSRGALSATFVDNSKESIRCIQMNIRALGVEKCSQVIYGDVFTILSNANSKAPLAKRSFDIIYADPPYETFTNKYSQESFSSQVIRLVDDSIDSGCPLLGSNGSLYIEDSSKVISDEHKGYKNLVLSSSRAMGRSALQHWMRL